MTAELTINGKPADFQAFVASIVEATIARLGAGTKTTSNGTFAKYQLYKLSDPDVQERCGVAGNSQATTVLARRLRKAGIHITANHRSGTTVTGEELNRYLTEYARNQKSYLSKN